MKNTSPAISFSLPEAAFVSLDIYDLKGRQVATLARRDMAAGDHRLQWNAEGLAGGMYLYRLQAGGASATRKIMLLK